MKKNLQRLVEAGLIKSFEGSKAQVNARPELAERDIKVAKAIMAHERDWAFSIAYKAIIPGMPSTVFPDSPPKQ